MDHKTFNTLLNELDEAYKNTLKQKNSKYSSNEDALHNFHEGSKMSGFTPTQCAWAYMTKHLMSLRDKIQSDNFDDRDDFLEKIQDSINYLRFIWCLGNEAMQLNDDNTHKSVIDSEHINLFDGEYHS